MPHVKYDYKVPQLFTLLGLLVLTSGTAFMWTTRQSSAKSSSQGAVAVAASQPKLSAEARSRIFPKPATKAERTAAQKTIDAQLQAFNTGNWAQAAKFQSAELRDNFSSPEAFGQMMQETYPAFINPRKVVYGTALNVNDSIQFEVILQGHNYARTRALYSLTKEAGNYRIQAVMGGAVPPPSAESEWD